MKEFQFNDKNDLETPIRRKNTTSLLHRNLWLPIFGILFILVTAVLVGGYYFYVKSSTDKSKLETPKYAVEDFMECGCNEKFDLAWDRIDSKSQTEFNLEVTNLKATPMPYQNQVTLRLLGGTTEGKTGKDLFIGTLKSSRHSILTDKAAGSEDSRFVSVKSYNTTGEIATVIILLSDNTDEVIECIREGGKWRIRLVDWFRRPKNEVWKRFSPPSGNWAAEFPTKPNVIEGQAYCAESIIEKAEFAVSYKDLDREEKDEFQLGLSSLATRIHNYHEASRRNIKMAGVNAIEVTYDINGSTSGDGRMVIRWLVVNSRLYTLIATKKEGKNENPQMMDRFFNSFSVLKQK